MKFKSDIEIQAGVEAGGSTGSNGQVLSSTGSGVAWIDQSAVTSASDFVFFNVKNETGSTILKGKGVMAVGTDGNSGHILVDEMVADGTVEPKYFLGVLEEDIANGAFARVISFGQLSQFDTRGQNGETWADGQILWCDPANPGDFTITEPDGPNVKIAAAFILNSSTNGKIQVRVQANEGIHDLHDTKITSQVDGDVLVWNNTDGVWFNDSTLNVDYTAGNVGIGTEAPSTNLDILGASDTYLTIRNTGGGFKSGIRMYGGSSGISNIWHDDTEANPPGIHFGASANIATTPTTQLYIKGSNGNVGIGTTDPGTDLEIGDGTGSPGLTLNKATTGTASLFFDNGGSNKNWIKADAAESLIFGTNNSTNVTIKEGGNVGIGTTSPNHKVDIYSNENIPLRIHRPNNANLDSSGAWGIGFSTRGDANTSTTDTRAGIFSYYNGNLFLATNSSSIVADPDAYARLTVTQTGNVGIGTTSPNANAKLHLYNSASATDVALRLTSNANSKTLIGFGDTVDQTAGAIKYDNATSEMSFEVLNSTEAMRINSSGNIGIGTTSPGAKLHLVSGTGVPYSLRLNSDATGTWQLGVGSTGYYDGSFLLQDASVGDRLRINPSGTFTLPAYNSTNQTGTPTYLLGTDASGNIVKTNTVPGSAAGPYLPLAGGTMTGTGSISMPDNFSLLLGGGIFKIFNDGSNSIIRSQGEPLLIDANDITFRGYSPYNSLMTIKSTGNVGIGTTSPAYKLDVNGSVNTAFGATNGYRINTNRVLSQVPGGIEIGVLDYKTTYPNISFNNDNTFRVQQNGSTRIIVNSSGNVGIGITAPSTKLDVAGNANISDTLAIGSLSTVPTASLGRALNIQVLANSSGTTVAQWLDIDRTITTDSTSAATWGMVLRNASTTTSTANDGKIYGAQIIGRHQGTGGIESAMGVRSTADINTTGTITTTGTLWGSYNEAQVTNGSVTFANSGIFGSASRGQVLGSGTVNITSQGVVGGALIGVLNNVNASVNRVVGGEFELDLQNGTTDKAHVVSLNTFNIVSPTNLSIDEFAYIYLGEDVAIPTTITDNAYFIKSLTSLPSELAGSIEATSFIKTGGTSSQFLKADGSIDSTSYAPATGGSYLPLAGGTMTGDLYLDDGNGATPSLYFKNGADNYWRYLMESGGDFSIKEGTSTRLTFQSGGNVGIGTTNPLSQLSIGSNAITTKKPTVVIADGVAGGSLVIRGLSPILSFDRTGASPENKILMDGVGLEFKTGTLDAEGDVDFKINADGSLQLAKGAKISNQVNTDIDTGAEVVAQVSTTDYTAAFFDFVIKKGTNVRSGTVYACHNGANVEFTETSTNDLGDTSDVTLNVDISGGNMRLLATVTSDDWSVKSLIRAI